VKRLGISIRRIPLRPVFEVGFGAYLVVERRDETQYVCFESAVGLVVAFERLDHVVRVDEDGVDVGRRMVHQPFVGRRVGAHTVVFLPDRFSSSDSGRPIAPVAVVIDGIAHTLWIILNRKRNVCASMTTETIEDPFTGENVAVEIPEGAEITDVVESYRTGVWGRDKKLEVKSSDGHMFAVKYN